MTSIGSNRFGLARTAAVAIAALLAVACGGGGGGGAGNPPNIGNGCGETVKKQFVLDTARQRYLFLDLLPASVNIDAFATSQDLLDNLTATARAQNRDRFFSRVTTITAEDSFLGAGNSLGFGFNLSVANNNTRLFVMQVIEGSAAGTGGFLRGDEILAIGTSDTTLENIGVILARSDGLDTALGPATAGVARSFRVLTAVGTTVVRNITKREFAINPVPASLVRTLPRVGLSPVGYIFFRSFISPADDALRSAFQSFRSQGVSDVIIDLRYNGGGLVPTAELLMNLLASNLTNQVMYRTRLNRNFTANQTTVRFASPALGQAIPAARIAFITTGVSASASELAINSLAPYAQVAIIGARTFGKPVGQTAHDIANCDFRLRLVTFGDENRDGYGDFYSGLPPGDANYTDAFCAASDDISRQLGDPTEISFAEALGWIDQNRCGVATFGGLQQKAQLRGETIDAAMFNSSRPAPAQVYSPGLM